MTIGDLMRSLVAELAAGGVPAPLHQSFTLATIWDDLARLAGEPSPPEVAALLAGWGAVPTHAARAVAPLAPRRPRHDE